MGLSSSQLITDLRNSTGLDSTDLPDASALRFLNRSWWEVCSKFKFREKETQTTLTTVAGTRDVNVPADMFATRIAVIINDELEHIQLDQIDEQTYENLYDSDSENENIPTMYFRYGSIIRLYPTPDDAYSLVVYYWKNLTDLAVLNDPSIPQSWHEIVLFGAIWRAKAELGDLDSKASFQMDQQRLIESATPVQTIETYDSNMFHAQYPGYNGSKFR